MVRRCKSSISALFVLPLLILTWPGGANAAIVTSHVTDVLLTTDGAFGGCMAKLEVSPRAVAPTCGANWVSFDCTGDFAADVVLAYRMLDQAQLAFASGKQIRVWFSEAQKHNGYCVANRVDLISD